VRFLVLLAGGAKSERAARFNNPRPFLRSERIERKQKRAAALPKARKLLIAHQPKAHFQRHGSKRAVIGAATGRQARITASPQSRRRPKGQSASTPAPRLRRSVPPATIPAW